MPSYHCVTVLNLTARSSKPQQFEADFQTAAGSVILKDAPKGLTIKVVETKLPSKKEAGSVFFEVEFEHEACYSQTEQQVESAAREHLCRISSRLQELLTGHPRLTDVQQEGLVCCTTLPLDEQAHFSY